MLNARAHFTCAAVSCVCLDLPTWWSGGPSQRQTSSNPPQFPDMTGDIPLLAISPAFKQKSPAFVVLGNLGLTVSVLVDIASH